MSLTRILFLGLTLAGLIFPTRRFYGWFTEHGFDLGGLREALTINLAATGATTSMLIVAAAAVIFMISEANARQDPLSLIAVPITVCLGPAVGLPFYLFLRTRKLD